MPSLYERLMKALSPGPICDDCRMEYDEPVYYTIVPEDEGSETHINTVDPTTLAVESCTGSLCPECAGPYLTPDDPDDPRKPKQ